MMQIRNHSGRRRLLALPVFLFLVFFSFSARSEEAGTAFSLSVPKEVKGYTHCEITVQSPAAGEVLLTLYDSLNNPWLYRRETLSDGENVLSWDGRGAGGELLMSGPYRLDAVLAAACRLSRSEAQRLVAAGLVKLNHAPTLRGDAKLSEGDLISARGYGRVKVVAFQGESRRGRQIVQVFKYGK